MQRWSSTTFFQSTISFESQPNLICTTYIMGKRWQDVSSVMCACLTLVLDLSKLFVILLERLTQLLVLCVYVVHPLDLQMQLLRQLQRRHRIYTHTHTHTHTVNTAFSKALKQLINTGSYNISLSSFHLLTHQGPDDLQIRVSASLKCFLQYVLKLVYVPIYQLGMHQMFRLFS